MAYDEQLADRVREVFSHEPVREKRMFGGLAFLIGGHLGLAVSGQGGLMVRVEPGEYVGLLSEPGVCTVEMGARGPMRGWVRVEPAVLEDDAALRAWVERGAAYARSLPPKQ